MKQMLQRHTGARQGGSALALVLIFMTVMLVLGTAMLAASQHSVAQSSSSVVAEKHYYAAESAAQLAAQMMLEELSTSAYVRKDGFLSEAAAIAAYPGMESEISRNLTDTHRRVESAINAMMFNGEAVSLGALNIAEPEIVKEPIELNHYDTGERTFTARVYLRNPTLTLTAMSGGRNVTVTIRVITVEEGPKVSEGTKPDVFYAEYYGDAYFNDKTSGIYGSADPNEKKLTYDMFCEAMKVLFKDAETLTVNSILNTSPVTNDHQSWNDFSVGATHVKSGTSTVNIDKNTQGLDTLQYLYVPGNLEISGDVSCPNLKGVYVGGSLTIMSDTSFKGNKALGSNILVGDSMKVNGNSNLKTILNCRFYVPNKIEILCMGKGESLDSNSIFVAYETDGRIEIYYNDQKNEMQVGSSNNIPQFYARSVLKMGTQGSKCYYYGIYATLGSSDIMEMGSPSDVPISGIVIGLSDKGKINTSLAPLSDTQKESLMDKGISWYIDKDGTIVSSGTADEALNNISYTNKGISIHETTGE